jgi:glutathione peroxidase
MRRFASCLLACSVVVAGAVAHHAASEVPPVLHFKMKSLSGEPVDLAKYQGKVLLIANTASECGFTPQYADLQAVNEKYAAQGLAVLGFPSNDFGAQEPGTSPQIAEFCKKNYGVTFDLFEKVVVKGDAKVPLYAWLTSADNTPSDPGEVKWNFEKFLIGRDGKVIARFRSKVKPTDDVVTKAIEAALAAK